MDGLKQAYRDYVCGCEIEGREPLDFEEWKQRYGRFGWGADEAAGLIITGGDEDEQ